MYGRVRGVISRSPHGYVDRIASSDPAQTSFDVHEQEPKDTFTGLFWPDGGEIHKYPTHVRMGFVSETLD